MSRAGVSRENFLRELTELSDPRLAELGLASLRLLLDALPVAVYLKDREGRLLFINRTCSEQFGDLGPEIGKKAHETYDSQVADAIVREDERAFTTGGLTVETLRQFPRGERNLLVRRVVLRGTELGDLLIGICEDVTPARATELELLRVRNISDTALLNAGALLIMVDFEGRVIRFNRACEEASGLKAENVLGRYYPSLFKDQELSGVRSEYLRDLLAKGEPFAFEAPWQLAIKEPRIISWTLVALKDSKGRVEHILGTGVDVTEHRRIERALTDSERQFRLLWERSNDGMRILDSSGRTLMVNEAYSKMVGRLPDELIGRPFWEVYGVPNGEAMKANWEAWEAGEPMPFRGEQRVKRPDGTFVWLDLLISKIEVPERETLTLTIARDITASRRQAAEVEAARAAAEAASAAKTQFLANMSHELRTPMNAILGLTSLVLDSPLDAIQHDHLETVRDSANSLLTMLNDLLDFSKTDAGMMRLDPVPFKLRETLDAVMRTKQLRHADKPVEVALHVDESLPEVIIGDPMRLRQILLNLLGNALKFTERGWVRLEVKKAGPDTAGAVRLRFAVIDTGIGISADKQSVIFEPFTQADGSTTRRYGGTGLGLSISTQLVHLMGGKLECHSELGKGSEFCFEIVLGVPVEPERAGEKAQLRILIAEDNPANRRYVRSLLEREGHEVSSASSGQEAVSSVLHGEYDLLLLDLQMPGMGGIAAATAIRDAERNRNDGEGRRLLIAAMTANDSPEYRAQCSECGMDAFLSKPIARGELEEVLKTASADACVRQDRQAAQINIGAALERVGGDKDLLHDVAQLFIADYPKSLVELRDAIDEQDASKVERAAHTLKGSVANFGAPLTVEAAFHLEKIGRSGDLSEAQSGLARLESCLQKLAPELAAL